MSQRVVSEDERYGVTYHAGIRYVHGLSQTDASLHSVLSPPATPAGNAQEPGKGGQ